MKKILVSLAILALCVPAMAVTVDLSEPANGVLRVSYALEAGETNIRGLALVFETTAGDAVIDGTDDVAAGQFNTFIDYAYANQTGYDVGVGHPIADPDAAGTLDPTGGISRFAVSMGYLDQTENQLGVVDSFFDIAYTLSTASEVTVTVDTLRGGIVGDDVVGATIQGGDVAANIQSLTAGEPECITAADTDYTDWVNLGKPDSWCNERQCHGDADGLQQQVGKQSYWVTNNDLNILIAGYVQPYVDETSDPWIAADFDRRAQQVGKQSYRVTNNDVSILIANYVTNPPEDCND